MTYNYHRFIFVQGDGTLWISLAALVDLFTNSYENYGIIKKENFSSKNIFYLKRPQYIPSPASNFDNGSIPVLSNAGKVNT